MVYLRLKNIFWGFSIRDLWLCQRVPVYERSKDGIIIHIHFYHAHVVGDIICTYLAYKAVLLWSLNEGWPILFDGTDNSEDVNDWLFPEQGL